MKKILLLIACSLSGLASAIEVSPLRAKRGDTVFVNPKRGITPSHVHNNYVIQGDQKRLSTGGEQGLWYNPNSTTHRGLGVIE